jgi:hypothetical protein
MDKGMPIMVDAVETPVATEAPAPSSSSPETVGAIQAHLDAFNDLVSETPVETPVVEETPVETPEEVPAASVPAEATPSEEEAVFGSETENKTAVEAAPAGSTLPAAYARTAKARGWTDTEIAEFHKANPELSMKTFERMHESRTKEIQEWAELGRKTRQTGTPAGAPSSTTPSPVSAVSPVPVSALTPINVAELKAKYGNEELIEALAGPVNAAIAALGPIVAGATNAQAQAQQVAQESLAKTVQEFFTAKDMAPYAQAYGTTIPTLTPAQIETRSKVLETADALIAGAAFQGRQLSVQDALVLAHDSVASGMKETIIRDQIRTKVQKREKGITLRPTNQGRRDAGGPPRSKAEMVSRTEDRLAKAFG